MAKKLKRESKLAKLVYAAGFDYDPKQDIIYSRMKAWQRYFGYAYAYDLAAPATISAIIDCEPFFFRYKKKDWMIELWKGQYGLETGGEIGVYICKQPHLNPILGKRPHDPENGRYFDCIGNRRQLKMSFTLYKNGVRLFSRDSEKHWWLTGFKWGVLSMPEELTMDLCITFPTIKMCTAFIDAVKKAGYQNINIDSKSVSFTFDKPTSYQPRIDPKFKNLVKSVEETNSEIVKHYEEFNLDNNDPNQIPHELEDELIEYFNSYTPKYFEKHLSAILHDSGYLSKDIMKDLETVFKHKLSKIGKMLKKLTNLINMQFG